MRTKNALETEVDALNMDRSRLYARTGDPKANRLINGYEGYLNETFLMPVVQSPGWKDIPEPVRRLQLEAMISKNKKRAVQMFAANNPEMALQLKIDRMDPDVREILGGIFAKK